MEEILRGVLPVAPTPFHEDGRVDEDGMRRVIDCLVDQSVDAVCILANYSEQFSLTDAERSDLSRISLEHMAGRRPIVVTISHFSTGIVVNRAREAQAMGASMVMMMPPYHGVGLVPSEETIFEQFRAVNEAISIPIMLQDAPISGAQLTVPFLARMARELDNLRYFKMESPFAADKLAALIQAAGSHIDGPFDGEEAVTLLADLDAGATGTMTSGLFPGYIRQIVDSYAEGRADTALKKWTECLPLINHENRQCGLRACKAAYAEGGVIRSAFVRHPLAPLSTRTHQRLIQLASDLNIIALSWGK
jgi:2-keto-3-deoxy-L-arabinonate dehydratase